MGKGLKLLEEKKKTHRTNIAEINRTRDEKKQKWQAKRKTFGCRELVFVVVAASSICYGRKNSKILR